MKPDSPDTPVTAYHLETALNDCCQAVGETLFSALKIANVKPEQLAQITMHLFEEAKNTRSTTAGNVTVGDMCRSALLTGWLERMPKRNS